MDPDEVPDDIEYQDHFWVELDEDGAITAFEPAPEMYERKKEDYQDAVEMAKEWEKREKRKWGEYDGE